MCRRGRANSWAFRLVAADIARRQVTIRQGIACMFRRFDCLRRHLMFASLIKLMRDEDGATAIEYGLIAALIAVAAVTIMGSVGSNLTSTFTTVAGKL